jgi:Zn ribbon nucleic-acid-binding protein
MAKLKKRSVQRVVCPTCKGNGFLKIIFDTNDTNIYQCWDCDSEGEFYVHEPQTIQSNYTIDPSTGDVVKLN